MIRQLHSSLFNFVCLLNVHPYAESGLGLNDRNGSAILREFSFGQVYVIFCPALIQAVFFITSPGQNLKRNVFQVLFFTQRQNQVIFRPGILPLFQRFSFRQDQGVCHGFGAQLFGLGIQMGVNSCRGGNIAVPQPFLDLLHGDTVLEQKARATMT